MPIANEPEKDIEIDDVKMIKDHIGFNYVA